jgi:pimeloyl-ACP methyl ester carboxylesterase
MMAGPRRPLPVASSPGASLPSVRSPDGARISYLTRGTGPAVIVLPGALSVAADYTAFARTLAERFTVHILERRGRGLSSPQGAGYSIDTEREDVLAVQRATGASFLVGHSFGGLVALEVARHNPTLTKIAVYEPGVSIDGSVPTGWMRGYQDKLAAQRHMDAFVEFVRGMNPESAGKVPPWLMPWLLRLFLRAAERKQIFSLLEQNLREHQEAARLDNSYRTYRDIAAGVLLLYGGKGYTRKTEETMQRLAAVLLRSDLRVFPKLDHFGINKKDPQEVGRTVSAYFLAAPRS